MSVKAKVDFALAPYTPPALDGGNFAVAVYTPQHQSITDYNFALVAYTIPALDAVDFALAGGTTYYGVLKRWTGATWVKAKLYTYTGAWEQKPLKRWDGSEWKEVDTTGV